MSRRARRDRERGAPGSGRARGDRGGGAPGRGRARAGGENPPPEGGGVPGGRIAVQIAVLLAVFGIAVGIAELAGAANLGVSFGVGQVAFALALIAMLSRA